MISSDEFQGFKNSYTTRPIDVKPNDKFCYVIVAIVDDSDKFWAAYRGLASWTPDEVAEQGDKLDYKTAVLLFPSLDAMGRKYNY